MMNGQKNNVLTWYIIRELLTYFAIAFIFFFLIFFVNHLLLTAEDILKKRVPVATVLLFIIYSLPFIIAQSGPFATLVGFLMSIGRFVSDNELLILRSSGYSYKFLLIPVLMLGMLISILSFGVNDFLLPLGSKAYNKLYLSIIVSNPAVELTPHSIKRTENSTLVIGDVEGQRVSDLLLFDTNSSGQQRIVIASEAKIKSAQNSAVIMQLDLQKANVVFLDINKPQNYDFLDSTRAVLNIFSSTFLPDYDEANPRELTSKDLKIKLDEMKKDLQADNLLYYNTYKLEYHKKFSLPFGSIFFAFLAFPLAIFFGKHNGQTIGLIIGIIIAVLYWAVMIIGQQFGLRNGLDGFWTMWFPNFLMLFIGLIFFVLVLKR